MLEPVLDGRKTLELVTSAGVSVVVALAAARIGLEPTLALTLLCLLFVGAIASPVTFVAGALVLAPIPSLEALVGVRFPFGMEPLNVMTALGLTVAAVTTRSSPLRGRRALTVALAAYLTVYAAAWWRTHAEAPTADAVSLLAKPLVTLALAVLVVQLLPREHLRAVPLAMAGMLAAVALSIALQRIGLYTTAHQELRGLELGSKQFGGLMLDGNSAGRLFGVFAVPAYLLASAFGHRRVGLGVLLIAVPVLLMTLSRSGMLGFAVGLLVVSLAQRRNLRGGKLLVGIATFAAAWASTAGRGQVDTVVASVGKFWVDANAASSGREQIWSQVLAFLDGGPHRWLVGGGLDSFREYALTSPLRHEFATHSMVLKLVTDGGVVFAVAAAAVVVCLWRLGSFDEPVGLALRTSLASLLAVGLALDVNLLGRGAVWLWVLAALASAQRATASHAATNRLAIGSALHGTRGARTASRTAADAT